MGTDNIKSDYSSTDTVLNQSSASPSSSNKKFIVLGICIVTILAIFMIGFLISGSFSHKTTAAQTQNSNSLLGTAKNSQPVDCGAENVVSSTEGNPSTNPPKLQCFIDAAKDCNTAKLTVNSTSSLPTGSSNTETVYYDINKDPNNACTLHFRQGQINHTFVEKISDQDKNVILSVLKRMENTEAICHFSNTTDLATLFESLYKGNIAVATTFKNGPYAKGLCSGSYFDTLGK